MVINSLRFLSDQVLTSPSFVKVLLAVIFSQHSNISSHSLVASLVLLRQPLIILRKLRWIWWVTFLLLLSKLFICAFYSLIIVFLSVGLSVFLVEVFWVPWKFKNFQYVSILPQMGEIFGCYSSRLSAHFLSLLIL